MRTTRTDRHEVGGPPCETTAGAVDAARRGVASGWADLYATYNPVVRGTARRWGLTPSDCDDVAAVTWLRLVENIDRLRNDAALVGWLVTTSRREAQAISRRRAREVPTGDSLDARSPRPLSDPGPPMEDVVEARATVAQLFRSLHLLSDRERALIEALIDPRDWSYRSISASLGMPVGAIGPVRQRAVRKLAAALSA
jgi:RNA polymerase sigma factor (sigma-70 family)